METASSDACDQRYSGQPVNAQHKKNGIFQLAFREREKNSSSPISVGVGK